MAEDWTQEQAIEAERQVLAEVERVRAALGASHVVILAFWPTGTDYQMIDAGSAPEPLAKLYGRLFHCYGGLGSVFGPSQRIH